MKETQALGESSKNICKECLRKGKYKGSSSYQSTAKDSSKEEEQYFGKNADLMFGVSVRLRKLIADDVAKLFKDRPCSTVEKLFAYDSVNWLNEWPPELVSILSSMLDLKHRDKMNVPLTE